MKEMLFDFKDYETCEPYITFSMEGTQNRLISFDSDEKGFTNIDFSYGPFYEKFKF